MSKKINISIPNKVRPNLISLFHEYLVRKSKEPIRVSDGYMMDDEEYEDMLSYWDREFPGWDKDLDNDDDSEILYPQSNCVVIPSKRRNGKRKPKNNVYANFWEYENDNNKNGKKKHKKSKKAHLIDINAPYSGEEEEYDFDDIHFATDDYDNGSKEIWFYPDYHEKGDKLEFNSLKDFSDYCDSMGYYVSPQVENDISWRYESHCCLCPESEREGLLEIMTEHSYGEMFYEACEEYELSEQ